MRRVESLSVEDADGGAKPPTRPPSQMLFFSCAVGLLVSFIVIGKSVQGCGSSKDLEHEQMQMGVISDWDVTLFPSYLKVSSGLMPIPMKESHAGRPGMHFIQTTDKTQPGYWELELDAAWENGIIPETLQQEILSDAVTREDFFAKVALAFDSLFTSIAESGIQLFIVSQGTERWVSSTCKWLQIYSTNLEGAWQHEWCNCFEYVKSGADAKARIEARTAMDSEQSRVCPMTIVVLSTNDIFKERHEPKPKRPLAKQELFRELTEALPTWRSFVAVGDDANDEIAAGKDLNMTTLWLKAYDNAPSLFPEQIGHIQEFLAHFSSEFFLSTSSGRHQHHEWPSISAESQDSDESED